MSPEVPNPESRNAPGPGAPTHERRAWLRPAALFAVVLALSIVEPTVLVGVPYALFVVAFPSRRLSALVVAGLAVVLAFGPGLRGGFWYTERGWAVLLGGWFVALTLRWPRLGFASRALGSVAGAGGVAALFMVVRPGSWNVVDWLIGERVRRGVATALEAVRVLQGGDTVSPALATTIYEAADLQADLFPAMVALASLAALGVAWWLYVRLAHGDRHGLAPAREFRFNDQLVWLLVGGLLMLAVGPGEGWTRLGSNAVAFMAALYALRGAAVVLFFYGGFSLFGTALLALGLLFVAPVILGGAVVIGLGDTWLDLRERARQLTA